MGSRARTLPMPPLAAPPELTEADGLLEEVEVHPRVSARAPEGALRPRERRLVERGEAPGTGGTLLGPGPACTPDRTLGVGIAIQVGDLLAGKYEASSLIGTGGDSFVMAAHHRGFDNEVALKFFKAELVGHDEARRRFAVELRSNLRLRSEHIVRVFDVEKLSNGQPFLVMERLHGYDLRVALQDRGRLTVAHSLEFALQICEALATAHAVGIVHLDLKPENLFVTGLPQAELLKVLDFGASREQHESSHRVATLSAQGSPPYMSPEQMRGSVYVDERSDIWSLGCVLYEMLSGRSPFKRRSLPEACAAVLEQPVLPLRTLRPELSAQLESVVLRCLSKDAYQRPQSVLELAEALVPFAPHCARHVRRCRQVMEEHRPSRSSGVHLLTRERKTVPAQAPSAWVESVLESGVCRSRPAKQAKPARVNARPARAYGPLLRQLAGLGLFVLACYAALRPSPRPHVVNTPALELRDLPGSMCELPVAEQPVHELLESVAPSELAPPALAVPVLSAAELRRSARKEQREQARLEEREQARLQVRRARWQARHGTPSASSEAPLVVPELPY